MSVEFIWLLSAAVFIVAVLYSSVGHAGATGYISVMTLLGLSAAVIKPTALSLNILVASIATIQFVRAGHFSFRLFWPFALAALPFAYIGGYFSLPANVFRITLGVVLLFSAWRLSMPEKIQDRDIRSPSVPLSLLIGAVLGLLSGLTGTGGGIFLTPVLLLMGWAKPKVAAGVSALFILINSASGLAGNWASTRFIPESIGWLLLAAALGGLVGSHMGSQKLAPLVIKRCLAVVLIFAGLKLLLL